jgi:branched-chain amino acid transport system permease protein
MAELIIIRWLITGGIYALLAVGFSFVFGVARIPNLAHTSFYMIAAYVMYIITTILGFHPILGAILAISLPTLMAIIFYVLVVDRIKEHELTTMIITIAFAVLAHEILLIKFGGESRRIAPFIPGFANLLGVSVPYQQIFTVAACVVVNVLVMVLLARAKLGLLIRAVAQDREIANLMGINTSRICLIVMGISAAIGAIAAVMVAPIFLASPDMWLDPLIIVLGAVVLGGLGSIKGSILGGYILGLAEVLIIYLFPQGGFLRGVASLVAIVLVLLIKPEGLFGVVFEEERL